MQSKVNGTKIEKSRGLGLDPATFGPTTARPKPTESRTLQNNYRIAHIFQA